jgi:hypothetical protein
LWGWGLGRWAPPPTPNPPIPNPQSPTNKIAQILINKYVYITQNKIN